MISKIRPFLYVLILIHSSKTFGQFAIIHDKDGTANIRRSAAIGSSINGKLEYGHLIYCIDESGNWTNIDYETNNNDGNGYIYKDRYILISTFQNIPIQIKSGNIIKLHKDSIEVTITQQHFNPSIHKFKYQKDSDKQIELIDNKRYWGCDGDMPTYEYRSIKIKIGQTIMEIPPSALKNLYQPSLSLTKVNFDKENETLFIQSSNSDGAGSYEIIWKIEKGKYKERFIAYGF